MKKYPDQHEIPSRSSDSLQDSPRQIETGNTNVESPKVSPECGESRVYLKIHRQGKNHAIGVCDQECIGLQLKQGKFQFKVTEAFFKGELVTIEKALPILKSADNFNAVGPNLIKCLIAQEIIHAEGVVKIEGIPIAIKIIF